MAAQFQFVMRSGPNVGKVFPLEAQEISIGRDNSNIVAINDPEVSRKHAKMELRGTAYVITDLGSTNGTFVNGTRLSGTQVLNPGDTVSFGEGIMLQYEAAYDPNATVISSAKAPKPVAAPARPAPAPTPAPAPAPAPAYSGQVPAGPVPPAAPAKKGGGRTVVIIVVVIVVLLCLCVGVPVLVDALKLDCVGPFKFISNILGPLLGYGACQ